MVVPRGGDTHLESLSGWWQGLVTVSEVYRWQFEAPSGTPPRQRSCCDFPPRLGPASGFKSSLCPSCLPSFSLLFPSAASSKIQLNITRVGGSLTTSPPSSLPGTQRRYPENKAIAMCHMWLMGGSFSASQEGGCVQRAREAWRDRNQDAPSGLPSPPCELGTCR